ncbi:MAG: hypothetical protein ACLFRU_00550 [Paracoccaceae bacterium]
MAGQAEFQARIERIRATRGDYRPAYDPADHPARAAADQAGGPGRLAMMTALLMLLGVAALGGTMMMPQAQDRIAALIGLPDPVIAGAPAETGAMAPSRQSEASVRPPVRRGAAPDSGDRMPAGGAGPVESFRAASGM